MRRMVAARVAGGSRRRPAAAAAVLALLGLMLGACSTTVTLSPSASPTATAGAGAAASPPSSPGAAEAPGTCRARGTSPYVLPDAACTPGATNPQVTQATIAATICRRGWTATVRPPASYTEQLKRRQMQAYGWPGPLGRFEEDHLVSLELGGAPSDPRNLWPEPGASPNPKDRVESAANRAVCEGRMQLADAQRAIAADWIALGRQLGEVPATIASP